MLGLVSASKYVKDVKETVEAAEAFAMLLAMGGRKKTSNDMMEDLRMVEKRECDWTAWRCSWCWRFWRFRWRNSGASTST